MQPTSCDAATAVRLPGRRPAGRSGTGTRPSLDLTTTPAVSKNPAAARCACASSRRDEFSCGGGAGGRLVDEGMVVLRRRIHEKEWYAAYDADVCRLLAGLQALLVGSRPAVGVGLVAALVLAVPASACVLVSLLLDASRAVISNLPQH